MTLMPIVIPVSTLVAIGDKHLCLKSDHANLKRFALLEVARIIEEEYRIQKNSKNLMAVTPQLIELLLELIPGGERFVVDFLLSSPVSISLLIAIAICRADPWTGPSFVGDGTGEAYLDATYDDSSGRAIIKVQDFFLSINYQAPGP